MLGSKLGCNFSRVFMAKKGSFSTQTTNRQLKDLVGDFLGQVKSLAKARPDLILKGWYEIVDLRWEGMTEASSFEKGTVVIKVKNAALYSLLVQQEGSKLLKKLQVKFPDSGIKKLKFCIG